MILLMPYHVTVTRCALAEVVDPLASRASLFRGIFSGSAQTHCKADSTKSSTRSRRLSIVPHPGRESRWKAGEAARRPSKALLDSYTEGWKKSYQELPCSLVLLDSNSLTAADHVIGLHTGSTPASALQLVAGGAQLGCFLSA